MSTIPPWTGEGLAWQDTVLPLDNESMGTTFHAVLFTAPSDAPLAVRVNVRAEAGAGSRALIQANARVGGALLSSAELHPLDVSFPPAPDQHERYLELLRSAGDTALYGMAQVQKHSPASGV
jgi:hypothetical protein